MYVCAQMILFFAQECTDEVFSFLDLALHLILYDPDPNVIEIMIWIVELYDPTLANDSDHSSAS